MVLTAAASFAQTGDRGIVRGAETLGGVVVGVPVDVDLRELPLPAGPIRVSPRWDPGDGWPVVDTPSRLDPLVEAQWGFRGGEPGIDEIHNFEGNHSAANPNDPTGDVGLDLFVEAINGPGGSPVTMYSKADASLQAGPFALDSLAPPGTQCANGLGDPIVLYDHLAQRWLLTEFSSFGDRMCVYVSRTEDPIEGGWCFYEFADSSFPDYPKYGVWPDLYLATANQGNNPPVYAFDRVNMLSPDGETCPTARAPQKTTGPGLPGLGFEAFTPVDLDGPPPPAGEPAYFVRHRDEELHGDPAPDPETDIIELWALDVDFDDSANTTFTQQPNIIVADFDSNLCPPLNAFSCIPQPDGGQPLDPLLEVIMNRASYRNFGTHASILSTLQTDVGDFEDHSGVRWIEARSSGGDDWTLFQEGTWSPDEEGRFMSTAAIDDAGNILLAYNVSSTEVYPSIRYTGRLASDPEGVMTLSETELGTGNGVNNSFRYGDYNQMGVDPVDGCTFWFLGMYNPNPSGDTKGVRIGAVSFDACVSTEAGTLAGTVTSAETGDPIEGVDISADDGAGGVFTTTTDSTGGYTLQLPAGTYDVTASAAGFEPATEIDVEIAAETTTFLDFQLEPVIGEGPIADISPDAFDFQVAPNSSSTQTLDVGNIGGADLLWSIDEAEGDALSSGVPYAYGLAETPAFHAPVGYDRASGIRANLAGAPADRVVLPAPQAGVIDELTESFDDTTLLPGAGWALINNSEPTGESSWFQGNASIFPSHEGAPDTYIAANFESTGDTGDISNWLLTPEVTVANGTQITFWTRTTEQFEEFYDRLEVRLSTAGASTDVGTTADSVGDFTELLLLTINPDLEPGEYPEEWTQFVVTVSGVPEPASGRFAFRYWVTDSGAQGNNGDYIGIDTVSVAQTGGGACDTPTDIPWLSTDPTNGTTPPSDSVPVGVTVDASTLDPGDYTAQLCVNTNDPAAPVVPVPVTLTVTAPPDGVWTPVALVVDPQTRDSNGNDIFEPGESVDIVPAWRNDGAVAQSVMGTASNFTGPAGPLYTLEDDSADYGSVDPGQQTDCQNNESCYIMAVDDPPTRPATHWDASFDEVLDDSAATAKSWTLHIGDSFTDVPDANLFYPTIETMLHNGITGGCTPGEYCPTSAISRAPMAVFVLRGAEGSGYQPEACVEDEEEFADVPFDSPFCRWIEELFRREVISGCGDGNYCPNAPVTRAQMSIFLLRSLLGSDYSPPECSGIFSDVGCPSLFGDWIEDLFNRGITDGCGDGIYCPADPVTRAQMSAFITATFELTLYGP